MQGNLEIALNTHSSCNDALAVFVGQLEKHWPNHPPVVVGHDCRCVIGGLRNYRVVDYSPASTFSSQYLMMLAAIRTPYCLTAQDDFILYADVDEEAIARVTRDLWSHAYACERLIDSGRELLYSMQASIWKTRDLMRLYADVGATDPWEAEIKSSVAMEMLSMQCRQRHDDHLPMRGRNHRDSPIFPYVSTALVRGKWNISEYSDILPQLLAQYGIDPNIRGTT